MTEENAKNTANMPDNEGLVMQIQAGNSNLMQQLFDQNEGFLKSYAFRFWQHLPEGEQNIFEVCDFVQCGWPALCAAIPAYKNESGCSFVSWWGFYLHKEFNAILGHRYNHNSEADKRQHWAFVNAHSVDEPIPGTDDLCIADTLEDEAALEPFEAAEEKVYQEELHAELARNIEQLKPQQQRIVNQYYFEDETLPAIAEHEGCSTAWAATQHKAALKRLKQNALRQTGTFKSNLESYLDIRTDFFGNTENQVIHRDFLRDAVAHNPGLLFCPCPRF